MTREEIIQAISDDKTMPFIQPDQLAQIVEFVIKNYQPSLPSELDKAAEEYEEEYGKYLYGLSTAFKAGAEWMAGQGINAESGICKLADRVWVTPINEKQFARDVYDNFVAGDKVIVQIRKK